MTKTPGTEAGPVTACIETDWTRTPQGYGWRYIKGVGTKRAHRWAWEQANGPIPPGLVVMHLCDNPPCINVEHLAIGTHADNIADRDRKGRTAIGDRNGATARRGVPRKGRSAPQPGEANGRAVLSLEDVQRIRSRSAAGETSAAIARDLGVHRTTVSRAISGARWRNV